MNKIGQVALVVFIMGIVYLIMLAVMIVVSDMSIAANATIAASGVDVEAMPGSTSFLLAAPWILWFMPAVVGMAVIIFILKRSDSK